MRGRLAVLLLAVLLLLPAAAPAAKFAPEAGWEAYFSPNGGAANAGIETFIDSVHAITHNKVMVRRS